jgi:hypothetical protein
MKKTLLWAIVATMLWLYIIPVFAINTNNNFEIVPQSNNADAVSNAVEVVGSKWWDVRSQYNKQAANLSGQVGDQLASWIMTRDTLLDYVVYLVRFLSQIGLVIGALMIIYAGYMYATTIFGGDSSKWKKAITNAIIGVLIISFSYAIMKLLTSALIT